MIWLNLEDLCNKLKTFTFLIFQSKNWQQLFCQFQAFLNNIKIFLLPVIILILSSIFYFISFSNYVSTKEPYTYKSLLYTGI